MHTWQTFLLICALPSFTSGVLVSFLPESPKFLMSKGRNDEAMKVFERIHRANMGSKAEYPVKKLVDERVAVKKPEGEQTRKSPLSRFINGIRGGFSQLSVMLEPTHFRNACLVYTIQFFILFGFVGKRIATEVVMKLFYNFPFSLNTFRLWVVQLFAIIKEYEDDFSDDIGASDANLCRMIEYKVNKTQLVFVENVSNVATKCEPVNLPLSSFHIRNLR